MRVWLLKNIVNLSGGQPPLEAATMETPVCGDGEILIQISCCGVCHTELDEIEGRTPPPRYPVVPGHQVVGRVAQRGNAATRFGEGDRVGVAWIYSACGECSYCRRGTENLCPQFLATGRDHHGGYAEYMTIDERFAYAIPPAFSDAEAAPLLCAGAIGYRSLKLTNLTDGQVLGLTGFGASGHLVLKMARHRFPSSPVFVFARSREEQDFARQLGAHWAGDTADAPPARADAIIDTTPAWKPVIASLLHLNPGGRLVINAIRKESHDVHDLTTLRYEDHLWMEKEIKSVANITRRDVEEFLQLAASIPIRPEVEIYAFEEANRALMDLKNKHVKGAKVLSMPPRRAP